MPGAIERGQNLNKETKEKVISEKEEKSGARPPKVKNQIKEESNKEKTETRKKTIVRSNSLPRICRNSTIEEL